ncbi:MAG: xanthine dehydrogenase family protein molybdopterin-binding subunit [Nannocystaceae bacterium]
MAEAVTVYTLRLGLEGAIKDVKIEAPAGEPRPWDASAQLRVIGHDTARVDGHLKVRGAAQYTHDVRLEGMLHAAVLRSPHPCCVVDSIDVEPARRRPGVQAAIAVAKAGDRLLFAGQDVAAVAARTRAEARAALAAIKVTYRPAPFVVDTAEAMSPSAPVVHAAGDAVTRRTEGDEPGEGSGGSDKGNVRTTPSMKKGDVQKGLRAAELKHEATYTTQCHTHSALETHSVVVRWEAKDKLTVWSSTQGIFSVRDEMVEIFDLKPRDVAVITEFMGGGFGAKFGASAPGSRLGWIAGELARQAKAPVSLLLDRHEEHVCTGNRPDSIQRVAIGATKAGDLTAIHVVAHGSAGIATGAGVGRNAFGIYSACPNARTESHDVFANTGPGTAFRAPGHPQGAFAVELALDELAAKSGLDPLALRLRNVTHPVRKRQLELGRERFQWAKRRADADARRGRGARVLHGVGVACSIWGDYGRKGAASVTVEVGRDGSVVVKNGVQDIGGGITTVLAMVVAEVLGRSVADVEVKLGRAEFGPSVGSGGSQTTSSVAPAARNAAEQVKAQLLEIAAKALDRKKASEVTLGPDGAFKAASKSIPWADLCKKIPGEAAVATATRPGNYGTAPLNLPSGQSYEIAGCQFAAVEVDTWTGVVRVPEILAIHDCGRAHNPLTTRSQINGGVILGVSYALMEQRVMDRRSGRMLNPNLESYKIAGARDVPTIDVVLTEVFTGGNSTGAIGIGEPATIPTAAAIACAVRHAIGAPVRDLPLTPDRVLAALGRVT